MRSLTCTANVALAAMAVDRMVNVLLSASAGWPMTLATGLAGTWLSLGTADLHAQSVSDSNANSVDASVVWHCWCCVGLHMTAVDDCLAFVHAVPGWWLLH